MDEQRRFASQKMRPFVAVWLVAGALGCSSGTPGARGGGGDRGAAGAGGTSGSGGSIPGDAGDGLAGSTGGNVAGTDGAIAGAGGAAAGSDGGGSTDGGGADSGAGAGASGITDAGPDVAPHTPVPSAGCGKPNPNMPKRTITTSGMTGTYNVNVPTDYNGTKPMPLGFGFHGYNNPACGPTGGECQGFAMLPAITVYMKSLTAGWEGQPQPLAENLQFYRDVLDVMKNEYCVDESRIFIAGVSSGGQFVEHIACLDGARLWQVTEVSAYVDKGADMNCVGTPPVLITQGATETNVTVATPTMFAKRNGCSATPPASYIQNLADMKMAFMMGKSEVRCMDWDGCTKNPVRYCISSQMTYGGLTHGWPRIGGMLISDFQNTLPK